MKKLQLYYIKKEYIDYLRKFDSKVPYNKKETRPYVGVVLCYNNINYFAPLSSPKPKHLKMNENALDIFKIKNGELGIVNINNMIPTPKECLIEVLPHVKDSKYKLLLQNQLMYLNNNKRRLYKKVIVFYKRYMKGYLSKNILDRCCNFTLLEEKCINYDKKESYLIENI